MFTMKKLDEIINEEVKNDPVINSAIKHIKKNISFYFLVYTLVATSFLYSINELNNKNNLNNNYNKKVEIQYQNNKHNNNKTHMKTSNFNGKNETKKENNQNKNIINTNKILNNSEKSNIYKRAYEIYKKGVLIPIKQNESISLISLYYTGDMFKWKEFINENYGDNYKIKINPTLVSLGQKVYIPKKYLKKEIKNYLY